ncbi:DUF6361 family protein [Occultella gossypii]|uniref:Uncharacterized protein n=1 Tax=Occultella gossypii TaxID=2800820 RepID=A0ABS7S6C4_9MICO|nr:DUF6361 family protein [Occultella gossypii]MBZ2195418.1 hypothetical protein [Occultella gossypii]
MSTSTFTWLQFDAEQSRRARELVRALEEPTTLDSLGIGTIRDGFANLFFPGTSTLHTRVRYFLLVPWAMQHVAARGPRSRDQYDRWLRDTEVATIDALKAGNSLETVGIIGRNRGANIQQLPSTIYWSGTAAWKIRLADRLTRGDARDVVLQHRQTRRTDDGQATPYLVWDTLPTPPDGFPEEPLSVFPTADEAEYLLAKMAQTRVPSSGLDAEAEPTLLARIAREPVQAEADYPWQVDRVVLSPYLRDLVDLAWGFSLVIQGARLRYLSLLFEARAARTGETPANRDLLEARLADWTNEMHDESDAVEHWLDRLPVMFETLSDQGARIGTAMREFVTTWSTRAVRDPVEALTDETLGHVIRMREATLKKSSARLTNPSPLLAWNGELVGADRLDFRWGVASAHIRDCVAALEVTDAQS